MRFQRKVITTYGILRENNRLRSGLCPTKTLMYDHFRLKSCISFCCDGRDAGNGSDESAVTERKSWRKSFRGWRRSKHEGGYSGLSCDCGQGWLW